MDDFPRKLSGLKAESLAALKAEVETRLLAARKQDQRQRAFELNTQRMAIMDALEQVRDETQARKEGARPKQCRHGVSMADTCPACREVYYQQKAVEQEWSSRRFTPAAQEQAALAWTPIAEDPQKGMTYGAIDRSATLAEYWNQTKLKPGELADALDRANLEAPKPGTFGSMFDAVKVRGLQEDAAAQAQAKQMVNERMARYVAMRQDLEMQLGAVMQGQSQPRVQVRRAPATVAPGPPMEAKRGYFDE